MFIKRRRTRRYDKETDLAAAEAATAPIPHFYDDDDEGYPRSAAPTGYGGGTAAGYGTGGPAPSHASSHGTYAQPAMGHEAYEMAGPSPGGVFDHNAYYGGNGGGGGYGNTEEYAGAGAAGIGIIRARSQNNANGGQDAFAAPEGAANPYAAYANSYPPQDQGHGAYGGYYAGGIPEEHPSHSPSIPSVPSSPPPPSVPPQESYASHYQPGFSSPANANNARLSAAYPGPSSGGHGDENTSLPNPFGKDDDLLSGEGGESDDDDDEVDDRGKVLKVANQ